MSASGTVSQPPTVDRESLNRRDAALLMHGLNSISAIETGGCLNIESGEGVYVRDSDGVRYLDTLACNCNMTFGYSYAPITDAIIDAFRRLPAYNTQHERTSQGSVELAERLASHAPMPVGKVLFGVSGSDANETAFKVAWAYHAARGDMRRHKILSREQSYHGGTIAAAGATGFAPWHAFFNLPMDLHRHLACADHDLGTERGLSTTALVDELIANVEAVIAREGAETIAAMIAEPIVFAARAGIAPPGYFERLRALLDHHGILLIADEVITGFGRTGAMFAAPAQGLRPDIVTLSKGLTGGYYPFSATLLSVEVGRVLSDRAREYDVFPHTFTNYGNPVGCAAALACISALEGGILDHVNEVAPHFAERIAALERFDHVTQPQSIGLGGGMRFRKDKAAHVKFEATQTFGSSYREAAREGGLYVRAGADSGMITPPLIVTPDEIDIMFDGIEAALRIATDRIALSPTTIGSAAP